MTANNSKHVVLAAWQALASRDPQRIAAMFTADAEWLAPKGNATAVALNGTSHMVGREQIAQSLGSDIWKLFTANVKVEFRGVYADGDVVIVEERMQATLANGNAYDNDYCFVFEVENGLIRRVREYMDTAKGHRMIFATDRSNHEGATMLLLKPNCECCDRDLAPDSRDAVICSFECTFCRACAEGVLKGRCPNCGGELVRRPIRPAAKLAKFPPSRERVFKPEGCAAATAR